jgi:sugar lactone lactonase YvrE
VIDRHAEYAHPEALRIEREYNDAVVARYGRAWVTLRINAADTSDYPRPVVQEDADLY